MKRGRSKTYATDGNTLEGWKFISKKPQWWPGIYEGLTKKQAEAQVSAPQPPSRNSR